MKTSKSMLIPSVVVMLTIVGCRDGEVVEGYFIRAIETKVFYPLDNAKHGNAVYFDFSPAQDTIAEVEFWDEVEEFSETLPEPRRTKVSKAVEELLYVKWRGTWIASPLRTFIVTEVLEVGPGPVVRMRYNDRRVDTAHRLQ